MYIPAPFREDDQARQLEFIRNHNFGTLITARDGAVAISHVPMYIASHQGKDCLVGHLAKANDHWQSAEGVATAVFNGPHAYVSQSWYEARNTVPTWNYIVAHVHGRLTLTDGKGLEEIIALMMAAHEGSPEGFKSGMDESVLSALMGHIVGFRLEIDRIEGKWKLSQNKTAETQAKIADRLFIQEDWNSKAVAEIMRANLPR